MFGCCFLSMFGFLPVFLFFFLETDDTSSDSEEGSTEYEGGSSGDDYVERSFQVLFIDDADIPEVV